MQFYEVKNSHAMIFIFYTAFKNHETIKIGNQTREKSHILS